MVHARVRILRQLYQDSIIPDMNLAGQPALPGRLGVPGRNAPTPSPLSGRGGLHSMKVARICPLALKATA